MNRITERLGVLKDLFENQQLVVVTKGRSADDIREVIAAGAMNIGENKLQEIQQKFDRKLFRELEQQNAHLHFLGHIQSNKVKKIVKFCDLIQSVDSIGIARKINQAAEQCNKVMPVYLQLNLTGEEQKYGFTKAELSQAIEAIDQLEHLHIEGLMCMGKAGDEQSTRAAFKTCRRLAEQSGLAEVSMGMSQDYRIALEEGSTMVRIGSALFEENTSHRG